MAKGITEKEPDPRIVYADIIDLPHHQSPTRPRMSLYARSAQFAPFAALSGYDEMIVEEARETDAGIVLEDWELEQLNQKLTLIADVLEDGKVTCNLTAQAAGIGNNLNQIARYFHGGGLASRGMLEELKRCIAEIRELRQEIVQLGGVYRGNSKTHRK